VKRLLFSALLLAAASCRPPTPGATRTSSLPGHGAVTLSIVPNPIVAMRVSGNTYDFPFDVVVRETAGRAVTVSRVSAEVYSTTRIRIASESWDSARINAAGYGTNVPGNGALRYHFAPRKSVPDERLFGGVYAELRVDAYDDTGTPASATTTVTVTR
jgi:hypothetical protein